MKRMRSLLFGFGAWLGAWALGCGGTGQAPHPGTDGGLDVGNDAAEAARPGGAGVPPGAGGEIRGVGACCAAAADCADGVCWNGFCTRTCDSTTACGIVSAPSPFPANTALTCP